tara:strand:- start:448 stop:1110 length:663 start_codon:yes stop_codon:yes gene_type:complete
MGQPVKQFFTTTLTQVSAQIIVNNLNASGNRSTTIGTEGWAFRTELMTPQRLTNGNYNTEIEWRTGDNAGNNWYTSSYSRRRCEYSHGYSTQNQTWASTGCSWTGSYNYNSSNCGNFVGAGGYSVGDEYDGVNSLVMDWWAPTTNTAPFVMSWGGGLSATTWTNTSTEGVVGFFAGNCTPTTYNYGFGSNGGSYYVQCVSGNFPIGTTLTMYEFTRANAE